MKQRYELICMSSDGDYVSNGEYDNIEQAESASSDMGSKWIFYPFHFILLGTRVIETGEGLIRMTDKKSFAELMFKNRYLKTVKKAFKETYNYCTTNSIECDDIYEFESVMIELNAKLIRNTNS